MFDLHIAWWLFALSTAGWLALFAWAHSKFTDLLDTIEQKDDEYEQLKSVVSDAFEELADVTYVVVDQWGDLSSIDGAWRLEPGTYAMLLLDDSEDDDEPGALH